MITNKDLTVQADQFEMILEMINLIHTMYSVIILIFGRNYCIT